MKRLMAVGLACVLSACVSSVAGLHQAKADKVADFPAALRSLSDCVYQNMKSMDSPYDFRLIARPDNLESYITTARPSDANTRRGQTGLELHFIAKGATTTVELREDTIGNGVLSLETWSIIERCSQQIAGPPTASPTAR